MSLNWKTYIFHCKTFFCLWNYEIHLSVSGRRADDPEHDYTTHRNPAVQVFIFFYRQLRLFCFPQIPNNVY